MAEESIDVLAPGDPAADFELRGTDGESYDLSDFADHEALLLVFTCNHCAYANAKKGFLNQLASNYDEVAVVGVNPNDNPDYPDDAYERMVEVVEEGRVRLDAYLFDPEQSVAAAYGAVCTPDPFLFTNDDGTFRLAYHGRLDDAPNPDDDPQREEMREAIEAVLAGEPVELDGLPSRGCSIKWRAGNEPEYWAAL